MAIFDDRYLEVSPHVDVFKAPKTEKITEFKKQLMEHYNLEANAFRLWSVHGRQNKTTRVGQFLNSNEEKLSKPMVYRPELLQSLT